MQHPTEQIRILAENIEHLKTLVMSSHVANQIIIETILDRDPDLKSVVIEKLHQFIENPTLSSNGRVAVKLVKDFVESPDSPKTPALKL